MRILRSCVASALALAAMATVVACGSSSSSSSSSSTAGSSSGSASASKSPITIGASLSLSGDFASDGQAFERGYELWAADQNAKGGLLGHPIKLKILSDASSPAQVVSNYQRLIGSDKVPLVFGPFSTLLTVPSARVAARYGYAFVEGAGGGPTVFGSGLHNVFDVSVPVKNNLVTFAQWVASLPASGAPQDGCVRDRATTRSPSLRSRPRSRSCRAPASRRSLRRCSRRRSPTTPRSPPRLRRPRPTSTVLGSVDVPTVSAFVHAFIQQHYNPKIFIATAGPDQGAAFVKAVGKGNENGIFVPNGWYGGFQKADSQQMVKEYIAKYGGTPSDINADVAEAYSVGQVVAQAVAANNSLDNAEDHQLSAQRRDSRQRARRRQVRRAGSEPGWEDTDVPMAEEHVGADTADVDAWIQASSVPEAGLGGLGSAGALPRR